MVDLKVKFDVLREWFPEEEKAIAGYEKENTDSAYHQCLFYLRSNGYQAPGTTAPIHSGHGVDTLEDLLVGKAGIIATKAGMDMRFEFC